MSTCATFTTLTWWTTYNVDKWRSSIRKKNRVAHSTYLIMLCPEVNENRIRRILTSERRSLPKRHSRNGAKSSAKDIRIVVTLPAQPGGYCRRHLAGFPSVTPGREGQGSYKVFLVSRSTRRQRRQKQKRRSYLLPLYSNPIRSHLQSISPFGVFTGTSHHAQG